MSKSFRNIMSAVSVSTYYLASNPLSLALVCCQWKARCAKERLEGEAGA